MASSKAWGARASLKSSQIRTSKEKSGQNGLNSRPVPRSWPSRSYKLANAAPRLRTVFISITCTFFDACHYLGVPEEMDARRSEPRPSLAFPKQLPAILKSARFGSHSPGWDSFSTGSRSSKAIESLFAPWRLFFQPLSASSQLSTAELCCAFSC